MVSFTISSLQMTLPTLIWLMKVKATLAGTNGLETSEAGHGAWEAVAGDGDDAKRGKAFAKGSFRT